MIRYLPMMCFISCWYLCFCYHFSNKVFQYYYKYSLPPRRLMTMLPLRTVQPLRA